MTLKEKTVALRTAQTHYDRARQNLATATAVLKLAKKERNREERRLKREARKAANHAIRYERAERQRLTRRAAGLCVKCGKSAIPSKRKNSNGWSPFCQAHHDSQLAADRKRTGAKPRKTLEGEQ